MPTADLASSVNSFLSGARAFFDHLADIRDLQAERVGVPVDSDRSQPELLRTHDCPALMPAGDGPRGAGDCRGATPAAEIRSTIAWRVRAAIRSHSSKSSDTRRPSPNKPA